MENVSAVTVSQISDADAGITMEPTADEMGAYLAELSAEERGQLRILVRDGTLEDVLRLIDRFETEQMAMYTIVGEGVA